MLTNTCACTFVVAKHRTSNIENLLPSFVRTPLRSQPIVVCCEKFNDAMQFSETSISIHTNINTHHTRNSHSLFNPEIAKKKKLFKQTLNFCNHHGICYLQGASIQVYHQHRSCCHRNKEVYVRWEGEDGWFLENKENLLRMMASKKRM